MERNLEKEIAAAKAAYEALIEEKNLADKTAAEAAAKKLAAEKQGRHEAIDAAQRLANEKYNEYKKAKATVEDLVHNYVRDYGAAKIHFSSSSPLTWFEDLFDI